MFVTKQNGFLALDPTTQRLGFGYCVCKVSASCGQLYIISLSLANYFLSETSENKLVDRETLQKV
jgi:hypothetical protein